MKLARAQVARSLNLPEPEYQGASAGNRQQLLQTLLHLRDRVRNLEAASGGANVNLLKPARSASPPPFAGLSVTPSSGKLIVQITNPQFQVNGKNTRATPIYHHIEVSDSPTFSRPVTIPVTGQNYLEVTRPAGSTNYVRLRSSFDGKTTNSPQYSGAVKA